MNNNISLFKWMLTFSVKIGGNLVPLLSKENKEPKSYKNVNVFSGMCTAANAKIRNLKYTGNGKGKIYVHGLGIWCTSLR